MYSFEAWDCISYINWRKLEKKSRRNKFNPKKIIYQPYLRTEIGNSVSNSNINMFFTVIITVIDKILITQKKKKVIKISKVIKLF